jgi:mannose-6-phosphate isomerase-like protein (cupin superfamily)
MNKRYDLTDYERDHLVDILKEEIGTNNKIKTNESTFIAQGAKHRLRNPLPNQKLKIIEVQSGSYVGEDDIERFEDQFGRS